MDSTHSPRSRVVAARTAPALFAHMVLQTANYEALKAWYIEVLAARVVHEGQGLCFLTYDDEHHRVAIKHAPNASVREREAAGVHHVAYTYPSLRELLANYLRLKEVGILPWWPINHGPTISLYYRDPDGNLVELQVDAFTSKDEAARFFESPEFAHNPIGVLIDPQALLRDYEAGVPLRQLTARPPLPPGATVADMRPTD